VLLRNAGLTICFGKPGHTARRCRIPTPTFVGYIEGAPEAEEEHCQPQVDRIIVIVTSKAAQVTTTNQGSRNRSAPKSIGKRTINGRSLTQISRGNELRFMDNDRHWEQYIGNS